MTAYPDREYLLQLGRYIYAVSALEGLVLGELGSRPGVPSELAAGKLAGRTMTKIADAIAKHLACVEHGDFRGWLQEAGNQLRITAEQRNHALHARPATLDEGQRLYRWRPTGPGRAAFGISSGWLATAIAEVEQRHEVLSGARPPAPSPSPSEPRPTAG